MDRLEGCYWILAEDIYFDEQIFILGLPGGKLVTKFVRKFIINRSDVKGR